MAQMKTDLQHVCVRLVYYIKTTTLNGWKSGISQINSARNGGKTAEMWKNSAFAE